MAEVAHLVVLGNGFDMDCGLPTKYTDYLDFCLLVYELANRCATSGQRVARIDKWCSDRPDSREGLRSLLKDAFCTDGDSFADWRPLIWNNFWIDYFAYARKKVNRRLKEDWVDFESEIARVVGQVELSMSRSGGPALRLDDFIDVDPSANWFEPLLATGSNTFKQYEFARRSTPSGAHFVSNKTYADLKKLLLESLRNVRLGLQKYLYDFVERIEQESTPGIERLSNEFALAKRRYVLSFNYTHTFYKEFQKKRADANADTKYCYLHGETRGDLATSNMVLGINEVDAGESVGEHLDFIEFRKYFQRIYFGNDTEYSSWLNELVDFARAGGELRMSVYGHSLAPTDKDVLSKFILTDGMHVTSYYYSQSAFAQQIANMVALISSDELIARTGGPNKTIEFRPQ